MLPDDIIELIRLWGDKIADVSKISVPAYIVASYSNTLHTMGTFRAWRSIGSTEKWLRIHDSQDEIGSIMPGTPGCIPNNKGIHILHTGGKYASYLQMPLIK